MKPPGQRHPPVNGKKAKDIAGQDHAAVKLGGHSRQNQQVNHEGEDTHQAIFPPGQIFVPLPVEDLVDNKEKEKEGTGPFMVPLPPQMVSHLEQQQDHHRKVYQNFGKYFRLHRRVSRSFKASGCR